jgi:hypothetical protein
MAFIALDNPSKWIMRADNQKEASIYAPYSSIFFGV